MNPLCFLVILTANILGIFTDPFEFDGDYGTQINPIRKTVFELVVPKNPNDSYGPLLSEVATPALLAELKVQPEFDGNVRAYTFLRNSPPELMKIDKILRDKAAREGKEFDLPLLGSTALLQGKNSEELKRNLLLALFTEENSRLVKKIDGLNKDYAVFSTPEGQLFFYWLYHSLNLQLAAQNPELIEQINFVKTQFAKTLGNALQRAQVFKEKLKKAGTGVLFTQESDRLVPSALIEDGSFWPIDDQNPNDGTFVLLRSDLWEPNYEIIPIEGYPGYDKGKLNLILATRKGSSQKFLLASGHGNSTDASDGRLQITLVMEKFHSLKSKYPNLQLAIGIDANTKTKEEVDQFRAHLADLGLQATDVGPTTIKKRMITTQHSKAGRFAIDEEDYIIILKNGLFDLTDQTVGFNTNQDPTRPLPNIENQSDHYPVGVRLVQHDCE